MVYKDAPIEHLGLGNIILRLNREKSLSVRKIVSHLEEEGYQWKGRSISKSAVQRWLKKHKDDGDAPSILDVGLDIEQETIGMFNSCKDIFNAQLDAVNKAMRNSKDGKIDTTALYALLGTAKTLLSQLELYMKKAQGAASGGALQAQINEYNARTLMIIKYVVNVEIKDEKSKTSFLTKLAETFAEPPEELVPSDDST